MKKRGAGEVLCLDIEYSEDKYFVVTNEVGAHRWKVGIYPVTR